MMSAWSTVKSYSTPLPLPCSPKIVAVGLLPWLRVGGIAGRNTETVCFPFPCPASGTAANKSFWLSPQTAAIRGFHSPENIFFRYLRDLINNRSDFSLAEKWMLQPCFHGFFHKLSWLSAPCIFQPSPLSTRSAWLGCHTQEFVTILHPCCQQYAFPPTASTV